MTWAWSALPDGSTQIDTGLGAPSTPVLGAGDTVLFARQVVDRWEKLAREHGAAYGVPVPWILGMIWAESGGHPNALGHDPGGTTGYGLMQLTSAGARAGLGPPEILDPSTNIRLGARFIKLACMRAGNTDLPRAAASYNAGSARPSNKSPWGLVETPGHISRVVAAANTAIRLLAGKVLDNAGKSGAPLALVLLLWWGLR